DRHAAMVRVLASDPQPDPLAMLHHSRGAEDRAGALRWAEIAAEQAERTLAFDQAARLYGVALDLAHDDRRGTLLVRRGASLANARRGGEAGDCFLAAADRPGMHAPDRAAIFDLRRRGAEQLLRSGRHADGLRAMREVLHSAGVRYPATLVFAVVRF